MVGGTVHQHQQPPQLAPPSSSSSTAPITTTEEDELLKRNTDCIYFLASPLTCKKGTECEFRHSDIARVNPRDCWYWLNGNCLNPKCAFRHPPLDGFLGPEVSTPMGPVTASHAVSYGMPKQGVACIFFQKGFCLKGHLCPFLHEPPNSINNKAAQQGLGNPVQEPPRAAYSGSGKPNQVQKTTQQATVQKPVELLTKQAPRMQAPPVKIASKPDRSLYHPYRVSENDRIINGKDADEHSQVPSPGFDVLVDNKHDLDDDKEEGEVRRSRGHDYDIPRSADYDFDRDLYHEQRDYDHHRSHRDSPDRYDSDLRHRISKQRRVSDNGLRSFVTREDESDRVPRRVSHQHHRDRDQGAFSSRLRGRLTIPGKSISPPNENNSRTQREINQSRYSPGRPLSLNQSRLRDRIKGRVGDNNDIDMKDRKGLYDNDMKFAGPKRLSELKRGRSSEVHEQLLSDGKVLEKRRNTREESRKSVDDLSFEGPKPLSEILKRKRGAENRVSSENNDTKETNKKATEGIPEIIVSTQKEEQVADLEPDLEPEKKTISSEVDKIEGAIMDEDALLDEELEAYDHREGDYDYEQIDGEEDYNLDEGEYVEEEDGDEFEKKDNVVYE